MHITLLFQIFLDTSIRPNPILKQCSNPAKPKTTSHLLRIIVYRACSGAEEIIADGSDAEMVDMAKLQLEEAKDICHSLEARLEADSAQIENLKYEQSKLTAEITGL